MAGSKVWQVVIRGDKNPRSRRNVPGKAIGSFRDVAGKETYIVLINQ